MQPDLHFISNRPIIHSDGLSLRSSITQTVYFIAGPREHAGPLSFGPGVISPNHPMLKLRTLRPSSARVR
jgi:hypothetical protein